jgi:S1-C subfamily serine protease
VVAAPASYLGVNIHDIDERTARVLGVSPGTGAEVTAVDHDAPAGKAGIHLRDVIVAVDGKPVKDAAQFRETMRGYPAGKEVALEIVRDAKPMEFKIKLADRAQLQQQAFERHFDPPMPRLGRSFTSAAAIQPAFSDDVQPDGPPINGDPGRLPGRPDAFGPRGEMRRGMGWGLGAELTPIGPQLADFFAVKEGTGMLVMNVEPGSPAALGGLQAGDVVLKMDGEPVLGPIDWMRGLEASQGKPIQLVVVRNRRVEVLVLPPVSHTRAWLQRPRPGVLPAA